MIPGRSAPTKACVHQVMRAFVLPVFLAGVPALCATPSPAQVPTPEGKAPVTVASPKTYISETPWFSILGDDGSSNDTVAFWAVKTGGALERNGFTSADLSPTRVTVYVDSGDGDIALNTAGAQTSVRIPRRVLYDGAVVTEALARAALTRLAQAAGKTAVPADHAVEAVAWEARISNSPGMIDHLCRRANALGPRPLSIISASATGPDVDAHRVFSFWLHRAIREDCRGDPRLALAEASIGVPLGDTLAKVIPDVAAGGVRADAWWPTALIRQTSSRMPPVETLDASETRLRDVSRFVVAENGKDIALDSNGLIARRKEPELLVAIKARLIELKTELPRTNPVWQNAFISRGLFLEKIAEAQPDELQKLSAAALAEAEVARRTSEEIAIALNGSQ